MISFPFDKGYDHYTVFKYGLIGVKNMNKKIAELINELQVT